MSQEDVTEAILNAEAHEPERPRPLRRDLPPPKPYPVDALGPTLGNAIRRINEVVKAPLALCAQSVIASVSLANQGYSNAVLDGRKYPLSLYLLTGGESGERKTSVDKLATAAIHKKQRELMLEFKADLENYQFELEEWADKKRSIRKSKELSDDEKQAAMESLGPKPEEPSLPMLISSEPTMAALLKRLYRGSPSMGLFSNDGGDMIGGHGMQKENMLNTIATLSHLWDGDSITRTRSDDAECFILYNRRLCFHLMLQGVVLLPLYTDPLLVDQGFLARCLFTFPETTIGSRLYERANLDEDPALNAYWNRISDILSVPYATKPELNELMLKDVAVHPSGSNVWEVFHNHVEINMADGKEFSGIRPFAAKAAEQVIRFAGNIARFEDPEVSYIQGEQIASAIAIVMFHLGELLRIQDARGMDRNILLSEKLLAWLHSRRVPTVKLTDIYQYGPREVRDAKTAKRLMGILEEHLWVTAVGYSKQGQGKKANVWSVKS